MSNEILRMDCLTEVNCGIFSREYLDEKELPREEGKDIVKDKSDFLKDVEVVAQVLEMQRKDNPQKEGKKLYRKYKETKNDAVRLAVALRGFFLPEGISNEQREEFGRFIQMQIVPAVQELIEEEDVEKIGFLEELGWFTQEQVELFIRTARERQKTASLVWLMHLKDEKYGYTEQDFFIW